jgi:hypothetical protein
MDIGEGAWQFRGGIPSNLGSLSLAHRHSAFDDARCPEEDSLGGLGMAEYIPRRA